MGKNMVKEHFPILMEQFLIKTYGYTEHDAKVKVMGDFEEVKEDFENNKIK
jgi:hypothetical protein